MAKKLSYVISCSIFLFMHSLVSAGDDSSHARDASHIPAFYFVRHGQTDWNAGNRVPGITDYELNAVGKQQVEELRKEMADITFSTCYVSDLKRACETASILTGNRIPTIQDTRLREREYGVLQGKENTPEEEWAAVLASIEKREDFVQRVTAFLQDLAHKPLKDAVLVVSHAGPMRIMLRHILQLSSSESLEIEIHNASYFKACFCDDQWVIDEMRDIIVPSCCTRPA